MTAELLGAGLPPAQDRLLTTLFLAALLHGILILGVGFGAPKFAARQHRGRGMQVILVSDQAPAVARNPRAAYLAQRSQRGAGNTLAHERARIPKSSPAPIDHPGIAGGQALSYPALPQSGDSDDAVITTTARATRIVYQRPSQPLASAAALPIRLENRPDLRMEANADGVELRLRGKARRSLWIAADTRAIDVAAYLDAWRRHVERIGTRNFPRAARLAGRTGTPLIQATIDANGRLAAVRIRRSSGNPAIDDAAIRILQLATPFAAFPRALAATHDAIRITYAWEFLDGTPAGSRVYTAPPAAPQGTRHRPPGAR
ncbi:MAG: energy transducer TonB [Gammaproteobacteria bacterium]|nr:energy transducer TonB [Gammaproteobacteria bacterium]